MKLYNNRPQESDKDCFECRVVSGCGLLGIGSYLFVQAKKNQTKAGKITVTAFSLGFIAMGIARLGQYGPFDRSEKS